MQETTRNLDANDGDRSPPAPRARWIVAAIVLLAVVVGPFLLFGEALEAHVVEWLDDRRPTPALVLAFGALLAVDVLLPVPSSVVAVAAGMRLGMVAAVPTLTVGATLGCAIGWGVGRGLGRPGLRWFVGADALARFDALVARHGVGALLLSRAVPVLAEASVIAAGAGRFALARTLAWTAAANLVIASVYAGAGELAAVAESPELALVIALGLPGVAMLLVRLRWRRDRAR